MSAFDVDCPRCARLAKASYQPSDQTIVIDPATSKTAIDRPRPSSRPPVAMIAMVAGMLVLGVVGGLGISALRRTPVVRTVPPDYPSPPPPPGSEPTATAEVTDADRAAFQAQWRNYVIAVEQDKWARNHNAKLKRSGR
jgi:hypothetical protein